MSNAVSHPSHYNSGKIEVIEAIEDWKIGFHLGNAVKYIARAGKKNPDKEVEDLEKAVWYLKRKIELLNAKRDGRETVRPNDMNPRHEPAFAHKLETVLEAAGDFEQESGTDWKEQTASEYAAQLRLEIEARHK